MNNIATGFYIVAMTVVLAPANAESLFNDATYKPIITDHRSFRPGQSVTVLIHEQALAASSADTDTNKSTDIAAAIRGNDNQDTGSLNLSSDFEGGGTISRTGKLIASVTVTIVETLPSGELLISGEQVIELNEEDQYIRLTGRVRPEDISASNTVLSGRVADAHIAYIGDGLLGKRQSPGIFTRFFNWLF